MPKRVFAIAAHPDDIEFQMAGTMLLLQKQGYELHYMNLANGSCGSKTIAKNDLIGIRNEEAIKAAHSIDAIFHEPITEDIAIFYEPKLLAKLASIMRSVAPEILLLQSPQDYMEDHQNTARLAATAAFTMGMPNFPTTPPYPAVDQSVALYHAQPHGNRDIFRQLMKPEFIVDISTVIDPKSNMLSCHKSQKTWLDHSQGMNSYITTMLEMSEEIGKMAKQVSYGEGWRRRSHLGYSNKEIKPLEEALDSYIFYPDSKM